MYKILIGLIVGFCLGVIFMNIPDVMNNSGTYRKLQIEQKKNKTF